MSSYDVLKKVTYTKNPDGTYSAVTDFGEDLGKLSSKEAQAAYKYKVPMGTIAEPDTGPSKVSENKSASTKPIGAKPDKAAKPAADKQTKANLAATNSAPKANSVSKGSLGAFQKWGEALPEGDTKEAARELYRKAKAGKISQTDLQKLQAELQAQVDKRKAAAEAKSAPKETKPAGKATPSAKADAPKEGPAASKTGATKIKSVASNPAAKATADAVKAAAAAAAKAPETIFDKLAKKGAGAAKTTVKGLGAAYVGKNVFDRGKEIYDDLGKGKTIGEALDKPESNKQVGEAILDTGLALAGMRAGSRFGLPGAVIGSVALPLVGKLGLRMGDVAIRGPKKQNETAQPSAQKEGRAVAPTRQYAYEEIESMAKQKGVPFEEAFRQLQQMQQEEINRRAPVEEVRRAEPAGETFAPSSGESASLAKEAVRAPIGQEPDIMSFLQQPDTEQMLAELAAKQASRVQSASNDAAPDTRKKRKSSSSFYEEEKTTNPANDRPLPRFYVNTGRFGTTMGAGSRRPLG